MIKYTLEITEDTFEELLNIKKILKYKDIGEVFRGFIALFFFFMREIDNGNKVYLGKDKETAEELRFFIFGKKSE